MMSAVLHTLKMLILLIFISSVSGEIKLEQDDYGIIRWCTVSLGEQWKCMNMSMAIKRDSKNGKFGPEALTLQCKQGFNKEECMTLLDSGEVHVTSLDAGEVFVGGRYHSLVPILQEVLDRGSKTYFSVAVIKRDSLRDLHSLRDLRGKKACFPYVGSHAGWVLPVEVLMKEGGMDIVDCNNHVKSAIEYFGPSCAVDSLVDKYNPIGDNSDKLCQLCIGAVPGGRCTSSDPYAGFEGALQCLVEKGDIAFMKHTTVDEVTKLGLRLPTVRKDNFQLLCRDGSKRSVDEYMSCNWGTVPSHAIVTSSAQAFDRRKIFQDFIKRALELYGGVVSTTFQRNSTSWDGGSDRDRDSETTLRPDSNVDSFGRPRNTDSFGRPQNTDRFGRPINNNDQNDRFGRPISNTDQFGRPVSSNTDQYGRPVSSNTDQFGRPISSNTDQFGRPVSSNTDQFGRPVSNSDRFGRPFNNDQFGRPRTERPDDRDAFGRPRNPDQFERQDQFGRQDDFDRRNQSQFDRDRFGNPFNTRNKRQSDRFRNQDSFGRNFGSQDNRGVNSLQGSQDTSFENFQLFESAPRYGIHHNLLVQDAARGMVVIDESQQTYAGYLGKALDAILAVRECQVRRMSLCVTSDQELDKCVKMRTALKAQLLKPEMTCFRGRSHIHCMQAIRNGDTDVAVFDASDVYTAGLRYDLIPFISEVYSLGEPEYFVIAVAREDDPSTELTFLKGKYTCHAGINTAAGWDIPLAYLISNGWIRSYGCDSIRAAAEYFGKSCVPGALSDEYNSGVPYDNLCHLCHGSSYRYCRRDASEDYFGHTGAFRCLVEGGGNVAFVKHTTVMENTDGKRREWWARNTLTDDFELLCPDGTRASMQDYARCNLGRVKANAIVTRGGAGYNETQLKAFTNLFVYAQQFYGRKDRDEYSFSMFYSSPPYSDLIFQDAAQQLMVLPPEERHFRPYLGRNFMRARSLVDCHAAAPITRTASLALLLTLALMALF